MLALEQGLFAENLAPEKRKELVKRLDSIEQAVHKMKVPTSFADQFYGLRGHISIVRDRLKNSKVMTGGD